MLQKMFKIFAKEKVKELEKTAKLPFDNAGCMSGAFELSLAYHGDVSADSDKVKRALPEVKIGIFSGAGGIQCVPRMTDLQQALQMLTPGQTVFAAEGQEHEYDP